MKMNNGQFERYITGRYTIHQEWYSKKARSNKFWFLLFQTLIILFSILTPILITVSLQSFAIIFGAAVALITGIVNLFKFHDNWINYRSISESLKKEKHYYEFKLCDYHGAASPETLFVSRVESLISKENTIWESCHSEKK
jgi:hypothetical protein